MTIHLVLGGARSGKSRFAEAQIRSLCEAGNAALGSEVVKKHYIATATHLDQEMASRIAHHQAQRIGEGWHLHECPSELSEQLVHFSQYDVVLIDCLTLWLNNVIYNGGETLSDENTQQRVAQLVTSIQRCRADIVLVSNEVGLGVVPLGEISRRFVDHAGWMNQAIAQVADKVTLVAAGLPVSLKS
ncbi:bifunctional adenosylcobinamide kinase/adenosylcobinamide-phosphate guanylyltransferase [Vibrio cholerae]